MHRANANLVQTTEEVLRNCDGLPKIPGSDIGRHHDELNSVRRWGLIKLVWKEAREVVDVSEKMIFTKC